MSFSLSSGEADSLVCYIVDHFLLIGRTHSRFLQIKLPNRMTAGARRKSYIKLNPYDTLSVERCSEVHSHGHCAKFTEYRLHQIAISKTRSTEFMVGFCRLSNFEVCIL